MSTFAAQPRRDEKAPDGFKIGLSLPFSSHCGVTRRVHGANDDIGHRANLPQHQLGDGSALTHEQQAGYELFKSAGCIACHQGQNAGGNMFQRFGLFGDYFEARGGVAPADQGRFNVTGNPQDRHVFRVPGLRNVALTAPYFHDGSGETLTRAVEVTALPAGQGADVRGDRAARGISGGAQRTVAAELDGSAGGGMNMMAKLRAAGAALGILAALGVAAALYVRTCPASLELRPLAAEHPELGAALRSLASEAARRLDAVEHLERKNSVLENSLLYLPLAARQTLAELERGAAPATSEAQLAISALVQAVLTQICWAAARRAPRWLL